MPTSRRVVITGLGAVTAAGWGVRALADRAVAGQTSIGPFTRFPHEAHRTHIAGEVPAPVPGTPFVPSWPRHAHTNRFAHFAAREAADQAKLPASLGDMAAGVFLGSSTGGLFETEVFYGQLTGAEPGSADRRLLASHQLSAPAEAIARDFDVTGPVETVSSACASAGLAIEQALRSVRSGECDLAITGGADALAVTTYAGFNALRAVDAEPCRPFSAARAGMSLGEGGAVLVIETLEHARARGVEPLAELLGAGSTCDAFHMTAPHDSGALAAEAMNRALADADVDRSQVSYINAHGTGTPLNDAAEWAAMAKVFGERLPEVPVEATKSLVGHLLGAAGAVEAVATVLGLQEHRVHPAPPAGPDPALPVDVVRGAPRPLPEARVAISSSLGFGGANVALVFGRWTGA